MAKENDISNIDRLKKADSFSGGENSKKKIKCPACGRFLEFIDIPDKKERCWAHKDRTRCRMYFEDKEEIEKYRASHKGVSKAKEENNKAAPEKASEVKADENKKNQDKDSKVESENGKPEADAQKSQEIITYTITLEEYESIGGDSTSLSELFSGIDKIFNNVARDAFMIAEPDDNEESSKVKKMPKLKPGMFDKAIKNPPKERSEKNLEKRAHVSDDKRIKITTAYSRIELEALEKNNPSRPAAKSPFLIYDSTVYPLSAAEKEGFLIGRSGDCDLVIKDKTISGHHAVIRRFSGKYYICDNSSNGTLIKTADAKARVPKGMFMELTQNTTIVLPHASIVFVC